MKDSHEVRLRTPLYVSFRPVWSVRIPPLLPLVHVCTLFLDEVLHGPFVKVFGLDTPVLSPLPVNKGEVVVVGNPDTVVAS